MRALRYIRQALKKDLAITVGRAIILSRMDYCNALLAGATEANMDRLKWVQNQLVRVVKRLSYRSHTSDFAPVVVCQYLPM